MTTKGSNNPFPSILLNEVATDGSDTPTPVADYQRLFLGEDGGLHLIDSSDVVTDVGGAGAHIADTSDAHDASAISFSPTGTIASTDVQAAIAEVSGDVSAITTNYPPPKIVQKVINSFTSGTSIVLTVAAPTAGNCCVVIVSATGRVADSITQTNVTWTKRKTNNGNSRYVEVWTGVASASAGTSVTIAFTGTNDCAAAFIELASTEPDFTAVGTEVAHTAASGSAITMGPLSTSAGDYFVWGVTAGQASSMSNSNMPYVPLNAFGGYARWGIGRSSGGNVWVDSFNVASNAFNGIIAVIS